MTAEFNKQYVFFVEWRSSILIMPKAGHLNCCSMNLHFNFSPFSERGDSTLICLWGAGLGYVFYNTFRICTAPSSKLIKCPFPARWVHNCKNDDSRLLELKVSSPKEF